jgi:hypothetical protein
MPKEEKLNARVIIEMLGAPKEHIEETIRSYVDQIKKESKTIKVLREHYAPAEKKDKLYSTFAEMDIEVDGAEELVFFCFDYMPSSVEVFEPEMLTYSSQGFTDFLNDLQGKLHKIDMALKNISAENQILKKSNSSLIRNIIKRILKDGPLSLESIAKETNMAQDAADKMMMALLAEKIVTYKDNLYSLA